MNGITKLNWAMGLPEAWRLLRMSLRPWRMAAVAFISIFVCVLIISFVTVISVNLRKEWELFSAEYYFSLIFYLSVYQSILWVLGVPALVCAALAQEFTVGTWVFQETSPQPAWKLLLGKIVGAPGDIYIASLVGLPFLIVCLVLTHLSIIVVLQACLFVIVISFFFSTLFLFLICVVGEQKNSSVIATILIPSFIMGSFILMVATGGGRSQQNNFVLLHPVVVFSEYLMPGLIAKDIIGFAKILFYRVEFPLLPFAIVFYAGWAVWFFMAAVGQIRFKMSLPMKRFHLFVLFVAVEVIFMGFVDNGMPQNSGRIGGMLVDMMALSAANIFMLYAVILLHSRNMSEIRPWLYAFGTRRLRVVDFFRDDAPVIFTIVPLLIIYLAGTVFLALMYRDVPNIRLVLMVQAATVIVIVLRDTLFFQGAGLMSKKGKRIGLFIYGLAFLAVPGLVLLANRGTPLLDLSPLTSIFAAGAANSIWKTGTLITIYLIVNGMLTVVFAAVNVYLFIRARARLSAEIAK